MVKKDNPLRPTSACYFTLH